MLGLSGMIGWGSAVRWGRRFTNYDILMTTFCAKLEMIRESSGMLISEVTTFFIEQDVYSSRLQNNPHHKPSILDILITPDVQEISQAKHNIITTKSCHSIWENNVQLIKSKEATVNRAKRVRDIQFIWKESEPKCSTVLCLINIAVITPTQFAETPRQYLNYRNP